MTSEQSYNKGGHEAHPWIPLLQLLILLSEATAIARTAASPRDSELQQLSGLPLQHMLQAKFCSCADACFSYPLKIGNDFRKSPHKRRMCAFKALRIALSDTSEAYVLYVANHSHCSDQAAAYAAVHVMQTIKNGSRSGERNVLEGLNDSLSVALVHLKERFAKAGASKLDNDLAYCSDILCRFKVDLQKNQQRFRLLSMRNPKPFIIVPLSFAIGNLNGFAACLIRCDSELPDCESRSRRDSDSNPGHGQCRYGDPGRASAKDRCPSVPPHNAIALTRRRTRAETIPPAHSLIPLWTRRHSATPWRVENCHG